VIQLSDLSKSFGDRTLIDHVTWQISDGDRVGKDVCERANDDAGQFLIQLVKRQPEAELPVGA